MNIVSQVNKIRIIMIEMVKRNKKVEATIDKEVRVIKDKKVEVNKDKDKNLIPILIQKIDQRKGINKENLRIKKNIIKHDRDLDKSHLDQQVEILEIKKIIRKHKDKIKKLSKGIKVYLDPHLLYHLHHPMVSQIRKKTIKSIKKA